MFILDILVYLALGFLVAYLYVKYNIQLVPEDKKWFVPMTRSEIKATIALWPLIVLLTIGTYVIHYITLPV